MEEKEAKECSFKPALYKPLNIYAFTNNEDKNNNSNV